jgi:hypothetical protein
MGLHLGFHPGANICGAKPPLPANLERGQLTVLGQLVSLFLANPQQLCDFTDCQDALVSHGLTHLKGSRSEQITNDDQKSPTRVRIKVGKLPSVPEAEGDLFEPTVTSGTFDRLVFVLHLQVTGALGTTLLHLWAVDDLETSACLAAHQDGVVSLWMRRDAEEELIGLVPA